MFFGRPAYQNGVKSVTGAAPRRPRHLDERRLQRRRGHVPELPRPPPGWYPTCGTSEATPEFAGIVALAGQVAGHPLGPINPLLYQLAAHHASGLVDVRRAATAWSSARAAGATR